MMTGQQHRVVNLAAGICEGRLSADDLPESDWQLLRQAADLSNPHSLPQIVSHRVLSNALKHRGYFAEQR